ncbi:MAG: VOC family protein [Candidatus Pollutiaquabacter aromativorans]
MSQGVISPAIGGFFFKSRDPKSLARWMEDRLGVPFGTQLYASFLWKTSPDDSMTGRTELGLFQQDTDYFSPSTADFMLNIRVTGLFQLLDQLQSKGATVLDQTQSFEYGHFGWVIDPDGNKIELWEPNEAGFGDLPAQTVSSRMTCEGIGGVFLKSRQPDQLSNWFREMFQLPMQGTMALFKNYPVHGIVQQVQVFSIMKEDSSYFAPSAQQFMLNFRVPDLDVVIRELNDHGETLVGEPESHPQGKFAWVLDPDGRKIELWQPA